MKYNIYCDETFIIFFVLTFFKDIPTYFYFFNANINACEFMVYFITIETR